MFNAMEGLNETCERIAGTFTRRGTVANIYPNVSQIPDVPEWNQAALSQDTEDEEGTVVCRTRISQLYAITEEPKTSAPRRGDAHGLVPRVSRHLDRWSMGKDRW